MSNPENLHDPTRRPEPLGVSPELAAEWAKASERAFSAALTDPPTYQRTARLIGALNEALGLAGPGLLALEQRWESRRSLLEQVTQDDPLLTLGGLEPDTVLGAAFAIRHRAAAEESAARNRAAILAVSADTDSWVVLEEHGYRPGDPFVPYHRIEGHAGSRRAILVTTRTDATMTRCVHVVLPLTIDPETGQIFTPEGAEEVEFADADAREEHVGRLHTHDW